MVFQGAALFDSMTVYDNVAFPLRERQRGIRADELRRRVVEKLRVVDLDEDVLARYPAELSGGMKKRVALARAVVHEPKIILYDEPTTGLDPITTAYVDEMILAAKKRLGVTSMVISHDIASSFKVADRLAVLYDGGIAAQGTPEEVRRSEHPYVQRYLSMWFEKQ
jgi:phospholipid/cholesterol/gamma-HCH transport system ATP-binding protein